MEGKKFNRIKKKRMTGWQLSTFEESYNYKLKEGVSLFKKAFRKKVI